MLVFGHQSCIYKSSTALHLEQLRQLLKLLLQAIGLSQYADAFAKVSKAVRLAVRIGPPSDHPSKQGSNCCTLRVRDCAFVVVSATHRCTSTNLTQFSRSLLVLSQC